MHKIRIEKLGSAGDGIGRLDGKPVYVANALPGELVATDDGLPHPDLLKILEPSPQRIEPACPHFGRCGGCTFQHADPQMILDWKRNEVAFAFSQEGIECEVEQTIATPQSSRRRATFTAQRQASGSDVILGFKEHRGEAVVDVKSCLILLPAFEAELNTLRALAKTLLRGNEEIQILVNACDNGMDLDFHLPQDPSEDMTAAFVRSIAKTRHLRASIKGEVVFEREKPYVMFGRARVAIPPGSFLQAASAAEQEIASLVCKHLGGRKMVADLFCGSGTFSLRLAERSKVHSVEMEENALEALRVATDTTGLKAITTLARDLHALPLTASELKPFDGICLDPPRAGAESQVHEIARADIRNLAYVSCNPATLARDAAILINGGYNLKQVTPVDQFVHSPHIEVVALFTKKASKASRSIFR